MMVLFIIVATIVVLVILVDLMGDNPMPWTCPACFYPGDEDMVGRSRSWFVVQRDRRVRCRRCGARFQERADGTLGPAFDL
jgi:hypothetical protein